MIPPRVDEPRRELSVEPIIRMYDEAWNTSSEPERRRLLEEAVTDDCELVEPRGRFGGRDAIIGRIAGFTDRFPGAKVQVTSNVDEHNGFARYRWTIVDGGGNEILRGLDVVERASNGRLRKIVMFFGELEST